ncbi:hypothetical protein PHLCEN_2v11567 [Hermanssonia centrifuga]|uniref:PEHE domain-containing protein n=1 Tax=Hermanssonia centrifuga TaxID=98765 RepID=A0A2R6NJN5_9APHY|nr:hypothetical protein PHLCEN_2v11567 [Hermanssonia centrifuga]
MHMVDTLTVLRFRRLAESSRSSRHQSSLSWTMRQWVVVSDLEAQKTCVVFHKPVTSLHTNVQHSHFCYCQNRFNQETADTSDAAYEKRHRKYETFEKRQRLREKEKLKHEQYKLKERIEQLRGMETSAFLALPASSFSEPPGVTHDGGYDENDTGISDLPGAHVNGAAAYNEGERRRKEMLDIAEVLEERYRVLLPPDRKWAEKKEKARLESASFSVESETDRLPEKVPERASTRVPEPRRFFEPMRLPTPEEEQSSVEVDELAADDEEPEPPRPAPKIAHPHDSDGESEVDFEERDRQRSKLLKLRIKVPPKMIPPKGPELAQMLPQIVPSKKKHKKSHTVKHQLSAPGAFSFPSFSPAQVRSISAKPGTIIRSADGKFLPKHKRFQGSLDELVPPSKRHRANSSASAAQAASPTKPHTAHPHGAHSPTKTPCALMIAAQRSSATPTARKTQRHVLAFGVRVPDEIEQVRDYEVPEWCFPESHRMSDDTGEWEIGAGLSENGPGSPEIGDPEWYQEFQDTKDDFPEIATLD